MSGGHDAAVFDLLLLLLLLPRLLDFFFGGGASSGLVFLWFWFFCFFSFFSFFWCCFFCLFSSVSCCGCVVGDVAFASSLPQAAARSASAKMTANRRVNLLLIYGSLHI